jgi:transposase
MERNPNLRSYPQQIVEGRTGRDIAEHLRELFVDRRWTDGEIADHLGVSRSTIIAWRRQFGIDRADRKAALA